MALSLPKFLTSNLNLKAPEFLKNPYVTAGASLFLVMYASMARPQLPPFISSLFDNAVFRVLVLALVVFMSGHNIQLSVMVAVAFTVSMNLLNEQKIAEGFVDGIRENMINESFMNQDDADSEESESTE